MKRTPDQIVAELLASRGITDTAMFLDPDFDRDTHDAWTMAGMQVAVQRLARAVQEQERVIIFGDYDADGIPATALLTRALRGLGAAPIPVIPTRAAGYGLTQQAAEYLASLKPNVLVTVDNGTVAQAEIAWLTEQGIEVIVIDHHEPQVGHTADTALALINPKQPACPYPEKELCACALTWKVAVALYQYLEKDWQSLKWLLDLVALSTVADMVPLVGENRVLVHFGLKVFRQTRNRGLQALAAVSGTALEAVSAGDLGYRFGPRLNAPSRMHREEQDGRNSVLQLLLTEDVDEADQLAQFLNEQNQERQALLEDHLRVAQELARAEKDAKVLVVSHPEWSSGLIGLVASRLVEQFGRPALVLAPEDGQLKGSVRSVEGISALALMEAAEPLLERFGGHAKAGGLTVKAGVEPEAVHRALLNSEVVNDVSLQEMRRRQQRLPDMELRLAEVTTDLCERLRVLEPFGLGFPTPLFRVRATLRQRRLVGREGQHLAGFLEAEHFSCKTIWFRAQTDLVANEQEQEWLVQVKEEVWNGIRSAQLVVSHAFLLTDDQSGISES